MSAADAGSVRERLAAGPTRGLGCAAEMAVEAVADADTLRELVRALQEERAVVVARAANALKNTQRLSPRLLDEFAGTLLSAASRCEVLEARWNLLLVLGGLRLTERRRAVVVDLCFEAMASRSALERAHAMQALMDVSGGDQELRARVQSAVVRALEDGSAAVRARARLLMAERKKAGSLRE